MKLTGLCVRSRAALETYVGGLGALLGPMLAVVGRSWALMGGLEPLLGPLCPVLGCSWSLCWRSWAALGPHVGGLGQLFSICWRSWAALGPYVGGLGLLLGPMLAVLGCSWGLSWLSWPLLGPKLAVLGRDQGESGPNPSGSRVCEGSGTRSRRSPPRRAVQVPIFSIDMWVVPYPRPPAKMMVSKR